MRPSALPETPALAALEHLPVPVLALNADSMKVALANGRFRDVFGYKAGELGDAAGWWRKAIPDETRREKALREWTRRVRQAVHGDTPPAPLEVVARAGHGLDLPVRLRMAAHSGLVILTLEEKPMEPTKGPDTAVPLVDPLTGFANKEAFLEGVEQGLSLASRHGQPLFLVAAAVDGLDDIAVRQGLDACDELLRHYAVMLRETMRKSDTAGSLGRGEFALLLPQTHRSGATRLVERLRQAQQESVFAYQGEALPFTVSYALTGIPAEMPWRAPSREQFMHTAEKALERAKREKRTLTVVEEYKA